MREPRLSVRFISVFLIFLRLGLSSFGGPVAHLGYFRETFVQRRCWLSDNQYADLVALCQLLPGPASSQVGMAIGLSHAGYPGLLAAWLGFTLPSALLLILAAVGLSHIDAAWLPGLVAGLKLVAVVVVAQAVIGMRKALVTGPRLVLIMLCCAALMLSVGGVGSQLLVILIGALAGRCWLNQKDAATGQEAALNHAQWITPRHARRWLLLFIAGLLLLPLLAQLYPQGWLRLVDGLYRSGALVFGGGHVVLPLLQNEVVASGLVEEGRFLAGYGLAQAVPGPLFTLSSFLGAAYADPALGWPAALSLGLLATLAIFLPAFLLLVGVLPFWQRLRAYPGMQPTLAGINAAVVGLLLAALWDPVILSAVHGAADLALLLILALMIWRRLPIGLIVLAGGAGGAVQALWL
ncbi:chromate efflux transporter [Marinobacterium sp. D7]|uniref:chromate efflux transporter n=1 Tax=Marinobacterium ramblicola TaxID=2849041 RepID=UPI001C2DEB32|nr:chromate efflux transporter [Marinobacterium ramblicola]MBV1788993.1 chromate efflux transporter [Marinobacterium ramblicola]